MQSETDSLAFSPFDLGLNVLLQFPLSRCREGPGLILIRPLKHQDCQQHNRSLDPEPLQKWAEESYAVVQVSVRDDSTIACGEIHLQIERGASELFSLPACKPKDKIGLLGERLSSGVPYGLRTGY